jgi:hypothetical protein
MAGLLRAQSRTHDAPARHVGSLMALLRSGMHDPSLLEWFVMFLHPSAAHRGMRHFTAAGPAPILFEASQGKPPLPSTAGCSRGVR